MNLLDIPGSLLAFVGDVIRLQDIKRDREKFRTDAIDLDAKLASSTRQLGEATEAAQSLRRELLQIKTDFEQLSGHLDTLGLQVTRSQAAFSNEREEVARLQAQLRHCQQQAAALTAQIQQLSQPGNNKPRDHNPYQNI